MPHWSRQKPVRQRIGPYKGVVVAVVILLSCNSRARHWIHDGTKRISNCGAKNNNKLNIEIKCYYLYLERGREIVHAASTICSTLVDLLYYRMRNAPTVFSCSVCVIQHYRMARCHWKTRNLSNHIIDIIIYVLWN